MAKLHIKKGDNVMVISGNNKGQSGRVLVIDIAVNRAIVEGVNLISKILNQMQITLRVVLLNRKLEYIYLT